MRSVLDEEAIRRYSRQILLREVGGRGQRRILDAGATLLFSSGAGDVAAEYLRRAGVFQLRRYSTESSSILFAIGFWDDEEAEDLYWAVAAGEGVSVGRGLAALRAETPIRTARAVSRGDGAATLLIGSALALLMLQGLLGLKTPSLVRLGEPSAG
jgi:hypothetical protein